jgi:hypothetical protein
MDGPITRDISEDGAGLSIPARSPSVSPAGNGGVFLLPSLLPSLGASPGLIFSAS